jgi:hypothetical protein
MTSTLTKRPPDCDRGTWGRIGPFTYDLWEGQRRRLYAVWHDNHASPLAFFTSPGECRRYIGSGDAAADLENKRTEEK